MDKGELEEKRASTLKSKSKKEARLPSLALPWKIKALYSFGGFFIDLSRRPDGSLNRRLASLVDPRVRASPRSSSVPTHDIVVDATRKLWFRLYLPKAAAASGNRTEPQLPLVVFFHGGGFTTLSAASYYHDSFCCRLARTIPAVVISVNYRLAPEHRFPAPYDDGHDVLSFLDKGPDVGTTGAVPSAAVETLFGVADLSRCYLSGDSAGGNIAHHVARRWTAIGSPVAVRLRLVGLVLLQPFFGGEERVDSEIRGRNEPLVNTERTDWMWRMFLPQGADRDHEAANVFGPKAGAAAELSENFPPVIVVVGALDPLQDWQRRYAEGVKDRGKKVKLMEYRRAFHGFYAFPCFKEARMVMDEIKAFVNDTGRQS